MANATDRSGIDWNDIERRSSPRTYPIRTCIACGATIREGAYSGNDGNWRKHLTACAAANTKQKEWSKTNG